MKDRQNNIGDSSGYVPVISPALHFLAMPGVVFLRSSFGIIYLRHKSIFLALAWVQILFTIYCWYEPGAWTRHRIEVIYGTAAALLYVLHLSITVVKQTRHTAEHDQYSGTSHLLRIFRTRNEEAEMYVQLGLEPVIVLAVSLCLRFVPGGEAIANWLLLVATAMGCKELINYWTRLRRGKRREDIFDDTKDAVNENPSGASSLPPLKASRKRGVKRPRASDETESHCAGILRMNHPYTLAQANQNYRDLIKKCHPDTHEGMRENADRAAQLNEALEYFREKFKE